MNRLIKYIFFILVVMVSDNLLSKSPIPIMLYEKLENGEVTLINKTLNCLIK